MKTLCGPPRETTPVYQLRRIDVISMQYHELGNMQKLKLYFSYFAIHRYFHPRRMLMLVAVTTVNGLQNAKRPNSQSPEGSRNSWLIGIWAHTSANQAQICCTLFGVTKLSIGYVHPHGGRNLHRRLALQQASERSSMNSLPNEKTYVHLGSVITNLVE